MTGDRTGLPFIDALAIAEIIKRNASQWGWSEKYTSQIVGKLTRGSRSIAPLDTQAAMNILSMCREGWGLYNALKRTRVTQRRYFAWIAKAHSGESCDDVYRDFRNQLNAVFDYLGAKEGFKESESVRRAILP